MRLLYIVVCIGLVDALPFLGKKTNYDEITARKLLNMAAGAYGEEKEACSQFVKVTPYNIFSLQGQLLLEGLQAIHPGVDFFDLGTVNRYFMNGHLVLWPEVEKTLNNPKYAGYKLIFTGHSLGGALAALAAARTVKQGLRPGDQVTMYTFGEPRVGDITFARNFDSMIKNSYRVVFRRDIVPHLPACAKDKTWFGDGDVSRPCDANDLTKPYHHGTEIWYPDSMEPGAHYIECVGEPRGEDFTCSDKIKFYHDQFNSYIWDHRHYFTVRVPQYGKAGCDHTLPEGKPGVLENIVNKINVLTRTIGLE
ncbi:unnamed protein product [Heligmosomoides polygyrus]|uniref:Lipase_3 domain-containing protein n=1 Tax=Heligmosomoides polygyrus TaxID=6339 RepID=A0A183FNC2_HELPZ|nr:unnamed protein product [Heligmosomoides polygyrus]